MIQRTLSSFGLRYYSNLKVGFVFLLSNSIHTTCTSRLVYYSTGTSTCCSSALAFAFAPVTEAAASPYDNKKRKFLSSASRSIASFRSKMMSTTFSFDVATSSSSAATMVIGTKETLEQVFASTDKCSELGLEQGTATAMLQSIDGNSGSASTFSKHHSRVILACIPSKVSRNNHPWSVHSITEMVAGSNLPANDTSRMVFVGKDAVEHPGALACAVAKAFPVYTRKTTKKDNHDQERSIRFEFWNEQGTVQTPLEDATKAALAACRGVQLAARLVDMPPEELTTDAYSQECRQLADSLPGVSMTEIVGDDLRQQGFGGLYGVGKAATCPPRLVILEYTPTTSPSTTTSDEKQIALVGKCIVYDTGGLSLKPKVGMCGMKADMGGSAGVLGGFISAVEAGYPHKLILILCMAENAIGPTAFRNDDILTLYSGKTVEVNNCDAEGRLVLGDGVAYATKHYPNVNLVVDMATLTGAQGVATGKKHAGILANTPELEAQAVAAGLRSGDLVFPLLYAPELLKSEFNSKVADMKNSVKDRSNAQSSCAGHFIESHLHEDYVGGWLHVDMASPSTNNERGTGYGVCLVLSLLGIPGF